MREYSIAAIPADGIGPEVIGAGVQVLESLQRRVGDIRFNFVNFDWGSDYYRKHGVMMPADGLGYAQKIRCDLFRRGRRAGCSGSHHALGPAAADLPGL